MPPRVLLADDHEVVRQALKALLERHGFQVVGEAPDGRAAVDAACRLRPDIAVLDVAMPLLNGVDAARELCRMSPATRVILLTALEDAHFVPEALQAGVRGFVMKSQGIDDLEDAIRTVQRGGLYARPRAGTTIASALLRNTRGYSRSVVARTRAHRLSRRMGDARPRQRARARRLSGAARGHRRRCARGRASRAARRHPDCGRTGAAQRRGAVSRAAS